MLASAHAVVLASGTLAPVASLQQQLFPHVPHERMHHFSCGHVVLLSPAWCICSQRSLPQCSPVDSHGSLLDISGSPAYRKRQLRFPSTAFSTDPFLVPHPAKFAVSGSSSAMRRYRRSGCWRWRWEGGRRGPRWICAMRAAARRPCWMRWAACCSTSAKQCPRSAAWQGHRDASFRLLRTLAFLV